MNQELAALKKNLAEQEQSLGADNEENWLTTVNTIGLFLKRQGKFKEADPFYRRALEGCERTLWRDHPNTLASVNNMGQLLRELGKPDLAEPFMR